jgi:hypothetical protein
MMTPVCGGRPMSLKMPNAAPSATPSRAGISVMMSSAVFIAA